MADFNKAIPVILAQEGGYVNDPADPGGETNFGISKRFYPQIDIAALTPEKAATIYRTDYWDHVAGDKLTNQAVATKLFSLAVNMGIVPAVKLLQQAICDCGLRLDVDGVIGAKTIAAANSVYPSDLLELLKQRAVLHYQRIATLNPARQKFLHGWINRALA